MPSLYLGKIGTKSKKVEVHAFTSGFPFREYPVSQVGDDTLFNCLIRERYRLLEEGRSIYCTAINPDQETKTETNPHDTREGCIHFASLDPEGKISCAVSIAVDIGEKHNGKRIGLPLENQWKKQGFPEGQKLDSFIERYPRLHWGREKSLLPWEMAECYRHFKVAGSKGNISTRLGLYVGAYHLLIREARNKGLVPTPLWVFDAIPKYFNLYKLVGCASLRYTAIEDDPRWLAPSPEKLIPKRDNSGETHLFYKGEKVSRNVPVPRVSIEDTQPNFTIKRIPFLDGAIDLHKLESYGQTHPYLLNIKNILGFSLADRLKMLLTLNVVGKRYILENRTKGKRWIRKWINDQARKFLQAQVWEFSEIGK